MVAGKAGGMIELDPGLADYFLVLERRESFGEYARDYGDTIADCYENRRVIVVPHVPIQFDLEFFQGIEFPPEMKKVGTVNGLEKPIIKRTERKLVVDAEHPLVAVFGNMAMAAYAQAQIASFNGQLRTGLAQLFPHYCSLAEGNITWRLTETVDEGLHFDVFDDGRPLSSRLKSLHRVKVFVNIDSEPRRWRTSRDLPALLEACRDRLPPELPDNINVVNDVIDKLGALEGQPYHRVAYPSMSAVIVNAEVVAHEVVYGRRMVAAEFRCENHDMLDPTRHTHAALAGWLKQAGYEIAADAAAFAARYAGLKRSREKILESRRR